MNKKMGSVFIILILASLIFISGCTQSQNNQSVQNNTTVQQNSTPAKAIDIVAVQKGPDTAKKGQNVTIQYEVSNNGYETVYNVTISSQQYGQNVGTLKSGETKKYTSALYIPTDAENKADFGPSATISNPFYIGGFAVLFIDAKGSNHTVRSNNITIKLV
jgi:hypothetical protein